jgi:hypothetical protein
MPDEFRAEIFRRPPRIQDQAAAILLDLAQATRPIAGFSLDGTDLSIVTSIGDKWAAIAAQGGSLQRCLEPMENIRTQLADRRLVQGRAQRISFDIAEFGRSLQHLKATVDELLKRANDLDRELSEIRDKSSKQGTESSKSRDEFPKSGDEFSKPGNESSQPGDEYPRPRTKFSKPGNEPSQRDNGSV